MDFIDEDETSEFIKSRGEDVLQELSVKGNLLFLSNWQDSHKWEEPIILTGNWNFWTTWLTISLEGFCMCSCSSQINDQ